MGKQVRAANRPKNDANSTASMVTLAEQAEGLTRQLMHDYHLDGDTTLWASLLDERSVWLGSGEAMLFGGAAILNHFREFVQWGTADILREEYHTLGADGPTVVVYGKLITRVRDGEGAGRRYRTMFSCCYGLVDGSLRLLMQHYTCEWQGTGLPMDTVDVARQEIASGTVPPALLTEKTAPLLETGRAGMADVAGRGGAVGVGNGGGAVAGAKAGASDGGTTQRGRRSRRQGEVESDAAHRGMGPATSASAAVPMSTRRAAGVDGPAWQSPQLKAAAFLMAHNLSVVDSDVARIPVHSDSQLLYIDPRTLMYAESRNHRTEVVTINKAFTCNITLSELAQLLPEYCCRVHRGYLVNAHYIAAIRRSEVELASGVVIPIPTPKYAATKAHLTDIIAGFKS